MFERTMLGASAGGQTRANYPDYPLEAQPVAAREPVAEVLSHALTALRESNQRIASLLELSSTDPGRAVQASQSVTSLAFDIRTEALGAQSLAMELMNRLGATL